MKKWTWGLIGVCLATLILSSVFMTGLKYEKLEYERVVDGDTFWVRNVRDGSEWKVRLWAVNAPDSKECYDKEATNILERELTGKKLVFERHGYDGFGRILAKVFVDGENVEEKLVATGAAEVYDAADVHDELKPSAEYVSALKKIEEKAKSEKLGMWSAACASM
jgi:micrococcal nuclease